MALTPAVFIDKDGTLVDDLPYNVDPAGIALRADAGPALARLQAAGFRLVLVSNQPGVALGLFAEPALDAVWAELARQLAPYGVAFAAVYYCPHHPASADPRYGGPCTCRKPLPGLLLQAAETHGLDLARSWMVGDILDDIEAGHAAGCRTVLLDVGSETEWRMGQGREPDFMVDSLTAAAACILDFQLPDSPGRPERAASEPRSGRLPGV